MKIFKAIDFWLSIIMFILLLISTNWDKELVIALPVFCFCIGIWHVVSMLVHFIAWQKITFKKIRLFYGRLAIIVLILCFTTDFLKFDDKTNIAFLFLLLMAIFYTSLCGYEVYGNKNIENV